MAASRSSASTPNAATDVPVEHATVGGRPGYRYGAAGHVYPYTEGSTASMRRAFHLAARQGAAVHVRQAQDGVRLDARAARPILPTAIEASYTAQLHRRVRATRDLLLERLLPALRASDLDARARVDSVASDLAALLRVVETTKRAVAKGAPPDTKALGATAASVGSFTGRQLTRQGLAAITIPDDPLLARWTRENVSLIKSIDARYFDDIEGVIKEAVRKGRPTSEVIALLQDRYAVSRSRAELIARDQVGKLNGAITESKQTALGVTHYRWSTSLDARVRPEHRVREGLVFAWKDPPEDGHPGEPIRCRCVAIAILPGDDTDDRPRGAQAFRGPFAR